MMRVTFGYRWNTSLEKQVTKPAGITQNIQKVSQELYEEMGHLGTE